MRSILIGVITLQLGKPTATVPGVQPYAPIVIFLLAVVVSMNVTVCVGHEKEPEGKSSCCT